MRIVWVEDPDQVIAYTLKYPWKVRGCIIEFCNGETSESKCLAPPPMVLVPRNASIERGKEAKLTCNVFSLAEKVQIKWYRLPQLMTRYELSTGGRHQIVTTRQSGGEEAEGATPNTYLSILTVNDASEADVGQYTCEAEHKGGVSSADGFVSIHGKPLPSLETS
ncbi:hypothetical protein Ciccas_002674 [Cichlidogyrus casuarinus]|uniref:Ig-like domain-containing protein n=1 Tax=Cichlidogyrus casuarinus TaxID=1844966 RepID=A0ABD2QGJ9_9PLAT